MNETAEEFFKRIGFDETTESNNKIRQEVDQEIDAIEAFLQESGFVEGSVSEKELIEFSKEIFDGKVEDYLTQEEQTIKEQVKTDVDNNKSEIIEQQKKEFQSKIKVEEYHTKEEQTIKEHVNMNVDRNKSGIILPQKKEFRSKIKVKAEPSEVKTTNNRKRKFEKIVFDIDPNKPRVLPPTKIRKVAVSKQPRGGATVSYSYNACAPVEDLRKKLLRKGGSNR